MVCYQTCFFVISIVTNNCTVLLQQKYTLNVCVVSFGCWSSCLKVYIYLLCIHTSTNNNTIFCVIDVITGDFYILILQKYSFKVCVISFGFYSTHYKVYIHFPCINTQKLTTAQFNITDVISSRDRQTPRLYQGLAHCCDGDNYPCIFVCFSHLKQFTNVTNQG